MYGTRSPGRGGPPIAAPAVGFGGNPRRRAAPAEGPAFSLNFLPVTLSASRFDGGLLPFETPEGLRALRVAHAATHVLHRQGDLIACVPLKKGAATLGAPRSFATGDHPGLVRKLLHEAIIRSLADRHFPLCSFAPPRFVARHPDRDLLASAVGAAHAAAMHWMHVYPEYTLGARVLYPRRRPPIAGVQIVIRTHAEIRLTVAQLLGQGVEVVGRYVLSDLHLEHRKHETDPRRDRLASRRLTGRVAALHQDDLRLEDAPEFGVVPAGRAWLEPRRENLVACLAAAGVPEVAAVMQRLEERTFEVTGARGLLERVTAIAAWLQEMGSLPLAADLACALGEPFAPSAGTDVGTFRRFPQPRFVFDPAGTKTDTWNDRGLQEHGPFDSEGFTTKRPVIAVVTPEECRGDVEVFLRKFKDGAPLPDTRARGPDTRHSFQPFAQGFVRKYHLNDCQFVFQAFDPGVQEGGAYRRACLRALDAPSRPDLAFVIIRERHKLLTGDDNPYLVSKSVFMSQGVAVQEVELETIRQPPELESSIPYALNNIGLACYAKLGGTPYVAAAAPGLAHELVMGIGSAAIRTGRLGEIERVVGITTVFAADGNYLLHNTSREVAYDDYPAELLRTLEEAVQHVRRRNGWQDGDAVRLIFHVFKPLRDVEAQAAKGLVERLAAFGVEYAFIHVSEAHDWVLFDRNGAGVQDWASGDPRLRGRWKGEWVPDRGYAVPLGERAMLLCTTGPRELKSPLQGAPRPLLLNLHRESTFVDLEYLAGQLFRFTALSWRSFFPSGRPVTISYSDRIAELLGQLRQVRNWNPDVLVTALRWSRWFL
jgi:hypothetical protein